MTAELKVIHQLPTVFLRRVEIMKALARSACLIAVWGVLATPLQASSLAPPKGTPILEIGGSIQVKNSGDTAVFDREMLESMGLETIVTNTPWDEGEVRYEGVPMAKLMAEVKAEGKTIRVLALNDYATIIPMEDFQKYKVILAMKRNGKYMPIREKGPLFIIYPFDDDPELNSQVYYARSAWQVKSIDVEP